MDVPSDEKIPETRFAEPEATVCCFYNSIFGHLRNWPQAFSCLTRAERERFEARGGIFAFADYWEDKLSFLEDLVKKRHREYPYRHRSCFSMDNVCYESLSGDHAVVLLELLENHLSRERLVVVQRKALFREGADWLLTNGELEGKLNEVITVHTLQRPRYAPV
ncbi:MAG: hypothetical protein C4520_04330 [Candidatus Abyssobacteria bacterium SURF_5]|uniref:Uncharacterized protein n=1 Tax=Abyssobacteria bacterium (strain SURF_5) TaxID=2093360 RepID=A0A3A4P084_ABYX5|nr:MAG: hypothetical protein C4520_04330 [Candidatus Abyssubacteria bacterium SURF_5]